jgi:anti-sigma regulatory factor (Ser/Thr protein kinase)
VKRTRSFTRLDQLPELLDFAAETAQPAGIPESLIFRTQVVLEEIFVNIFKHAYQGKDGPVEVVLEAEEGSVSLRVTDWGPPFDPLSAQTPDLSKRLAEGVPGGAGLVLVRGMAVDTRYIREGSGNILSLRVKE